MSRGRRVGGRGRWAAGRAAGRGGRGMGLGTGVPCPPAWRGPEWEAEAAWVPGMDALLVPRSGRGRGAVPPRRSGRGSEPGPAGPAREGGAPGGAGPLQPPGEEGDRAQDVWQWVLESERPGKPKPHR